MIPATDWKEVIAPGEHELFERLGHKIVELQRSSAKGRASRRGLHNKANVGVAGEFTVLPDLPEHARVGLFAKPGTHRAYVRFSNGANAHQSDTKGDVRGIAVKVLGVEGKKIIPGMESAQTQDFLAIRNPSTPFSSPEEFIHVASAASNPLVGFPALPFKIGLGRVLTIAKAMGAGLSMPMVSVATATYFSALPIQYGKYAVKYRLKPHTAADPSARPGSGKNYLAEELAPRLKAGTVSWDFQIQFFVDEKRTPIEDATVEWLESDAPFHTVGRLTLSQQDCTSERGRKLADYLETLSFDPWHALTEFRPLGAMMRARNNAYRLSTQERKAAPEPDGTEKFE